MSENIAMRGNELIKKIQKLGKKRGVKVKVDAKRGKVVMSLFILELGNKP
jgi:formylmethanofuran dehydrogenase subunit D